MRGNCRSPPCTTRRVVTATRVWRVEAGSVIDVTSSPVGALSGMSHAGFLSTLYTVEPLNKGHLRTGGIVPYSEVVPYWEVFQKKLSNDIKSPRKNRELIRGALFQWKHYSTSDCWHVRYTNNHGSKENPLN